MSRYTILQVSAEAYADIRQRIVAIDEKIGHNVYAQEFIRPAFRSHPERLALDQVHLEALPVALAPEPVAWRVRDYADGWIYFTQESAAAACRAETGGLMEPLYSAS